MVVARCRESFWDARGVEFEAKRVFDLGHTIFKGSSQENNAPKSYAPKFVRGIQPVRPPRSRTLYCGIVCLALSSLVLPFVSFWAVLSVLSISFVLLRLVYLVYFSMSCIALPVVSFLSGLPVCSGPWSDLI